MKENTSLNFPLLNNPTCANLAVYISIPQLVTWWEHFLNPSLTKQISTYWSFLLQKKTAHFILPILVEPPAAIFGQMFCPDSRQSPQTMWSFNIPNNPNYDHRWGLQNCNSFHNFFLVYFRTWSVSFSYDMSHTSFVTDESCQVHRF